jgi:hypothetical protein
MFWRLGGQFMVVGGWLVQAQGTPQNSINTLLYYTYCVLIAYYTVWDVSEVRTTHPCYKAKESDTHVCLQMHPSSTRYVALDTECYIDAYYLLVCMPPTHKLSQ